MWTYTTTHESPEYVARLAALAIEERAFLSLTIAEQSAEVRRLYNAAKALGAREAHNSCVGGDLDLFGIESPSDELVAAHGAYVRASRYHDGYVHGPERRAYYNRPD